MRVSKDREVTEAKSIPRWNSGVENIVFGETR